jgi:type IV secretion system protein VirD4
MHPNQRPRPTGRPAGNDGFELGLVLILGTLMAVIGVVYVGAWLATAVNGGKVSGGLTELLPVVGRLAQHPGDPQTAWGDLATNLPSPRLYWSCTITLLIAAVVVAIGMAKLWRGLSTPKQTRLGVDLDARIATAADVKPIKIDTAVPPTGRMLLGRLAPKGPMLATEDRERHPMRGRRAEARQGDRGSVALIGPTRSGKTVLASAGIIGWDGPVIALSVKRDLYDATAAARAQRGDIAVFDPSSVTGLPTARWTPLRAITTTSGAARAGRALAAAIPTNGVTGGDYWKSHGETLTSAYMALAGLSVLVKTVDGKKRAPLTMGRLASWAFLHAGVTEPTANELIQLGVANDQPLETRLLAKDALTKLMTFEGEDPKIRASIYATARMAFQAWNEPAIAHSASLDPRAFYHSDEIREHEPVYVDLDWLMGGPEGKPRTLYMSAPSTEFDRLAPVFGGMLGDLREQIHAWDIGGRKLEQPLMILIDEAGQLELQWFPEEVSTIAGLGGMFVTGWQSKSQITARYGQLADAVLSGHRSKIFFNGTDDPSSLDYATRIAGTVHVNQRGTSTDGTGRKTVSEHPQREDLLPAHVIRQMRRTDAVLFHGTLPPIHLRLVKWWKNKELRALVPYGATDMTSNDLRDWFRRKPLLPPSDGTCPVADAPRGEVAPVIDEAVIAEQLAGLPKPKPVAGRTSLAEAAASARATKPAKATAQGTLDFQAARVADDEEPTDRNRVAGYCARCKKWNEVGAGTNLLYGGRTVIHCHPACEPKPAPTAKNDGTPGVAESHQTGVVDINSTPPGGLGKAPFETTAS